MPMTREQAAITLGLDPDANLEDIKSNYTNLVLDLQSDFPIGKEEVQSFITYTIAFHTLTNPFSEKENEEPVFSCFVRPLDFPVPQIKPLFDRCVALAFHFNLMERKAFSISCNYRTRDAANVTATSIIPFKSYKKPLRRFDAYDLISLNFSEMAFPRHWLQEILEKLRLDTYNYNCLLKAIHFPKNYILNQKEIDYVKAITKEPLPYDNSESNAQALILGAQLGIIIALCLSAVTMNLLILSLPIVVLPIALAIVFDRDHREFVEDQKTLRIVPTADTDLESEIIKLEKTLGREWLPGLKVKQAQDYVEHDPYKDYKPCEPHDNLLNASLKNGIKAKM
jgi:hypothetical protein